MSLKDCIHKLACEFQTVFDSLEGIKNNLKSDPVYCENATKFSLERRDDVINIMAKLREFAKREDA